MLVKLGCIVTVCRITAVTTIYIALVMPASTKALYLAPQSCSWCLRTIATRSLVDLVPGRNPAPSLFSFTLLQRNLKISKRQLQTSSVSFGRGSKQKFKEKEKESSDAKDDVALSIPEPDDYSALHSAIEQAHEKLRAELVKIKVGGTARDLEGIESIRIRIPDDGDRQGSSGVVGDFASVIPRGRNVHVIVGSKEVCLNIFFLLQDVCSMYSDFIQDVKYVRSALSQPPHNLNPQPLPTDPLTLNISIPPVTTEARTSAAEVASQKAEGALYAIREARGAHKKRLRAWELSRQITTDTLRGTEKEMEKINENAVNAVKKMVEQSKIRLLGK